MKKKSSQKHPHVFLTARLLQLYLYQHLFPYNTSYMIIAGVNHNHIHKGELTMKHIR